MNLTTKLIAITAAWAIGTIAYAVYIVRSVLAGPPSGDLYANTLSYQVTMFIFYRLPPLLILLASVCGLEVARYRACRAQSRPWLQVGVYAGAVGLVILGIVVVARGMTVGGGGPYTYSLEFNLLSFFRFALPLATAIVVVPVLALSPTLQPRLGDSSKGVSSDRAS